MVDSLSVKSDHHLLASSNPRHDAAMLRDLSINLVDQLNTLMTEYDKLLQLQTQAGERSFSDTVLIDHHGNHGMALCQSSTVEQDEELRSLCQSSTVEQEVRALSEKEKKKWKNKFSKHFGFKVKTECSY